MYLAEKFWITSTPLQMKIKTHWFLQIAILHAFWTFKKKLYDMNSDIKFYFHKWIVTLYIITWGNPNNW